MLRRILIVMLFVFGMMNAFAFDAEPQQTIVGQNNSAVDIQAVQKAVDQGGTILLKGAFDFGDKGRVNITKDVKIIGETDNKGTPMTKIKGGFWTLHSSLPAKLPSEVPGPKITIQAIHFDGALWAPICLAYSSGATISNNKMTNIRPIASPVPILGKPGLNMQQGIICSPAFAQPGKSRRFIPNAFTGDLIVEGNDIDLTNNVPTKTMAQGVFVTWTTGINALIQRNTVINCTRNSIETIDNFLGKDGTGLVTIKDNKIVTATQGVPVPSPATPNGIIVGWFLDMSGGVDPKRNIKYIVSNNAIRTRGKTSGGIVAFTDGVVIVANGILSEGADSTGIGVFSSDGYIAYNRMEGTSSRPAMGVRIWKPFKGSKNVFVDNDVSQFKTSAVHVALDKDTCNNLFIGSSCKVIDLGSYNSIQMTK
jgi:hypothetical protein